MLSTYLTKNSHFGRYISAQFFFAGSLSYTARRDAVRHKGLYINNKGLPQNMLSRESIKGSAVLLVEASGLQVTASTEKAVQRARKGLDTQEYAYVRDNSNT